MPFRRLTRLLPLLATLATHLRAVTPLPIGPLLQHKAHYFDLEHKRLRFTPHGAAYQVAVTPLHAAIHRGNPVGKSTDAKGQNWRTPLPFPFRFGGKTWDEVYINLNGNLTFSAPERDKSPEAVATLLWKDPDRYSLLDFHRYHWSDFLATPAMTPVWPLFSDREYPEHSVMGGMAVEMLPGGHGHSLNAPWGAPTGLCALDLYEMGLIGPQEVPDTFFISGATPAEDGSAHGGEIVPVRIPDIIAANGPQKPAPKDSQRRFRFQIYLLHEDGRAPDPAKLEQARGIEAMLAKYFTQATAGRMTVVPTR